MQAVQNYYEAVWELRNWVRHGPIAHSDRAPGNRRDEQAVAEYQRDVEVWAEQLIDALRQLPNVNRVKMTSCSSSTASCVWGSVTGHRSPQWKSPPLGKCV